MANWVLTRPSISWLRERGVAAKVGLLVLFLACCLLAGGCKAKPHPLMEREYASMSDSGLAAYYNDLGLEIERCEEANEVDEPLVAGGMAYGRNSALKMTRSPYRYCNPSKFRARRYEVRKEMERRGINP